MSQTLQNYSNNGLDGVKVEYQPINCAGTDVGSPVVTLQTIVMNPVLSTICNTSAITNPITTLLTSILTQLQNVNVNLDQIEVLIATTNSSILTLQTVLDSDIQTTNDILTDIDSNLEVLLTYGQSCPTRYFVEVCNQIDLTSLTTIIANFSAQNHIDLVNILNTLVQIQSVISDFADQNHTDLEQIHDDLVAILNEEDYEVDVQTMLDLVTGNAVIRKQYFEDNLLVSTEYYNQNGTQYTPSNVQQVVPFVYVLNLIEDNTKATADILQAATISCGGMGSVPLSVNMCNVSVLSTILTNILNKLNAACNANPINVNVCNQLSLTTTNNILTDIEINTQATADILTAATLPCADDNAVALNVNICNASDSVGDSCENPIYSEICGTVEVEIDTSCEKPLFVEICNTPTVIGDSCENPIYVENCTPITVDVAIDSSCEEPLYVSVCNFPDTPEVIGDSCENPIYTEVCSPIIVDSSCFAPVYTNICNTELNVSVNSTCFDPVFTQICGTPTVNVNSSCMTPVYTQICGTVPVSLTTSCGSPLYVSQCNVPDDYEYTVEQAYDVTSQCNDNGVQLFTGGTLFITSNTSASIFTYTFTSALNAQTFYDALLPYLGTADRCLEFNHGGSALNYSANARRIESMSFVSTTQVRFQVSNINTYANNGCVSARGKSAQVTVGGQLNVNLTNAAITLVRTDTVITRNEIEIIKKWKNGIWQGVEYRSLNGTTYTLQGTLQIPNHVSIKTEPELRETQWVIGNLEQGTVTIPEGLKELTITLYDPSTNLNITLNNGNNIILVPGVRNEVTFKADAPYFDGTKVVKAELHKFLVTPFPGTAKWQWFGTTNTV